MRAFFGRLLLVGVLMGCGAVPASADAWSAARAQQREERLALRQQVEADRAARAGAAAERIAALLDQIEADRLRPDAASLWFLIAGLERLDPQRLGGLPQRVRGLLPEEAPTGRAARPDRKFTAALTAARKDLTDPAYDTLRRAAALGEVEVAVELLRQVLLFDPDHKAIRKALGQVRLDDKYADQLPRKTAADGAAVPETAGLDPDHNWFSPFAADMIRKGLVWNDALGWMPVGQDERYARGQIYDLQRQQWDNLASANAYHARPGRDWVIRTEHLEVRGTAGLENLALVATQLEAMYDEIFAVYAAFFAGGRRNDPLRLALGLAEHKPFVVWVYADHPEYVQRAKAPQWSGGIFRHSNLTCYFYGGPSETMYHEFTHQVLHVMAGQNESPPWLTEAIAVYTQTIGMDGDRVTFRGAPFFDQMSLPRLLALDTHEAWSRHNQGSGPSSYAAAGSLATFCMQAQAGRFRADFIDFVRDHYRGETRNKTLWQYMGLSSQEFGRLYLQWGQGGRVR